jgi:hypothetical protein
MTIFVTLAVSALAFAVIVYPFFKRREDDEVEWLADALPAGQPATLRDLDLDRDSGILSAEDYREQEARQFGRPSPSPARVEASADAGASAGAEAPSGGAGVEDQIERRVRELRSGRAAFCSQCGKKVKEGSRFCSSCGAQLRGGS